MIISNGVKDLNVPQASFLITRMLDELVALVVSAWEVRDGGVDKLPITFEGEEPIGKLAFVEQHFDPYKHIDIKSFMVNLGSYLSELIRVFSMQGIAEFSVLMDFLTQNVDTIHYMGSVIHRIEEDKKSEQDRYSDFS